LSYQNELLAKIKIFILTWISYAFKDPKIKMEEEAIHSNKKGKNFGEILDAVIYGDNHSKKKDLFVHLPNLIYFGKNKKPENFGIIDEENISTEQKKSMNIWMHILNINLKKTTFKKLSLHSLENYEYNDVRGL